jgi:[CysO sulfur-carrier protein]-S-L-cysteine hydrolase
MAEQIAPNEFRIIDCSIDSVTGANAHFVRAPQPHNSVLAQFFALTGHDYLRFNYLGEWHSHPCFPVAPSSIDIRSMQELVESESSIPFALLLIVRLDAAMSLEASATLFLRHQAPIPMTLLHDDGRPV